MNMSAMVLPAGRPLVQYPAIQPLSPMRMTRNDLYVLMHNLASGGGTPNRKALA